MLPTTIANRVQLVPSSLEPDGWGREATDPAAKDLLFDPSDASLV